MADETMDVNFSAFLMLDKISEYLGSLQQQPTLLIAVIATVFSLLLGFLVLFLWKRKSSGGKKDALLIIGPTRSGKTSLFFKLTGKDWKGTVTSIVPNVEYTKVGVDLEANMKVIDLPGSPCLGYFLQRYIKNAAIVIFVVDGADFLPDINDTAEKMWQLLDDAAFKKQPAPILIAINKSDLGAKCHTERFICTRLQREVDTIRKQQPHLSQEAGTFTFDGLKSEVATAKISVKLSELNPLHEFITKHAN